MQRVLSFPPAARGFGDPNEFVSKRMCFSFMFSLGFLAFLGGFLLGRFVFDQELELSRSKLKKAHLHHQQVFGIYKNYSQYNLSNVLDDISESALEEHMTLLRNGSVSDATSAAVREAEILRDHLQANGFDLVSPLVESQIQLSYPSSRLLNRVLIVEGEDNVIFQFNDTRKRYNGQEPEDATAAVIIQGDVVYVNFGRNEDYHFLDSIGVTVTGNIVLSRIGAISAVDIINNALDHEAKGILLYHDPQQNGAPQPLLSPGDLAKLQIIHGNHIDKWNGKIPLLEIDSRDVEKIFSYMSVGELSAESWRGSLKCSYPIGPGFSNPNWRMKMEINTVNIAKTYFDVLGAIKGSQEPDRFVVLANEKTAQDKQVQTISVLMEVVRVLGNLKKKGWSPHRSIVVAFWGSEGPNQHIISHPETLWTQLITKTVTYLKVDSSYDVGADRTHSVATPILEKLFRKSAKAAAMNNPSMDFMLPLLGENLFIHNGVPFLRMDTFNSWPNETIKGIASFWGATTWNVAESHGLPFSLDSYVRFFTHSIQVVEKRFKTIAQKHTLFLDTLFASVKELVVTMKSFEDKWSHADKSKSIEMRIMNDQLLDFVHSLTCDREQGPFPNVFRSGHLIFTKSLTGSDERAGFGVLQDLLREMTSTRSPEDLHQQIITHLAALVECVNLARYTLTEDLETFINWKT